MYKVKISIRPKVDIDKKEGYECVAKLIREFIQKNNKKLKEEHYQSKFSYYTFNQMVPFEEDGVYKKGEVYNVELKTIVDEFKDIKKHKNLETDKLEMVAVSVSKLYYSPKGKLRSVTPVFLKTKKIETEDYLNKVKERIRENMIFRYLKSNLNTNNDIEYLRKHLIKEINVNPKFITIPFKGKRTKNGNYLLYHCIHVEVEFEDNEVAKEVEKIIYASGLGLNTSNGFGYME